MNKDIYVAVFLKLLFTSGTMGFGNWQVPALRILYETGVAYNTASSKLSEAYNFASATASKTIKSAVDALTSIHDSTCRDDCTDKYIPANFNSL